MQYLSPWDIVESAKMQLDIPHQSEDLYLYKQTLDAEKKMFTRGSLQRQVVFNIPVNKGVAEIPWNFHTLVDLRGFTDKSNKHNEKPKYPSYLETSFFPCEINSLNRSDGDTTDLRDWFYYQYNVFGYDNTDRLPDLLDETFQIAQNYIYFSDGCNFEVIDLAFKGLNIDEDGDLKIPENHSDAIENYLCYRYCKKYHERFPMNLTKEYKYEWGLQKRRARGQDAMLSPRESELVGLIMNSYFPNFHLKK